MSTLLDEHKQRKEQVVNLLESAAAYYDKLQSLEANEGQTTMGDKAKALRDLKEKTEKGFFSIVVVGQFSAGKSTFLNALMGDCYLPSFSDETTATINILRSIKDSPIEGKEALVINYKDNCVPQIVDSVDVSTIEKYVSTRGDQVAQKVESVEVFFDSKYLNDGVCLVDSPGLNGVLKGHKEITDQQIERSHAAIFMFTATQPGSASDFSILSSLKKKCGSVIIVLNRIDCVNPSEQSVESVIETLKKNYTSQFSDDTVPEIWPIAAYPALVARSKQDLHYHDDKTHTAEQKAEFLKNSRIEAFEDRLMRYLTKGEKTKKELQSPVEKVFSSIDTTVKNLKAEVETLKSDATVEDLESEKANIEKEKNELESRMKSISSEINAKTHEIFRSAEKEVKANTHGIKEKYWSKLKEADEIDNLYQDAELYMSRMSGEYADVYTDALANVEGAYRDLLTTQFSSLADQVQERLNGLAGDDMSLDRIKIDSSQFDVDVDLADFLEKKAKLRAEMGELENKSDEANMLVFRAEAALRKRQRFEEQIAQTRKDYKDELGMMGSRPEATVYHRTEMESYERNRRFIFGWEFGGLFGKKTETRPVTRTEVDDSAQRNWENERERLTSERDAEINRLQAELDKIPDSDPEEKRMQQKRIEREQKNIQEKLNELDEKMKAMVAKVQRDNRRKAENYLDQLIDDFEKNGRDKFIDALKAKEGQMSDIAKDFIKENLKDVLEQKENDYKTLIQKMSESKESIEKAIEQKESLIKEAMVIKEKAFDLQNEIEDIETDKIKDADDNY